MGKQYIRDEDNIDGKGYMPGIALDTVIFGYHEGQLKIMLLEYRSRGIFALPGGFIHTDENLNDAAKRVLQQRTSLDNIFLNQFYVFGDVDRHNSGQLKKIMEANGLNPPENHWLLKRFISVAFYALVDFTQAIPKPDMISNSCLWYNISELPAILLEDHELIILKALETLRANLDSMLIGFNLLPQTFTIGELQGLYETVLGKPLLRPAFQRKMLKMNILKRIAKKQTGKAYKAPYLYQFVHNV